MFEQTEYFAPSLSILEGEGPVELQIEYCAGFELDGDFSELPVWEFGGIGWSMIGNPENGSSLLGNFLAPPPTTFEILRDKVSSTTTELGGNARETIGVFDTAELAPGDYIVGLTGTYVLAEPIEGGPGLLRQEVMFEYGFPLTIVPEPSASTIGLIGALLFVGPIRRR